MAFVIVRELAASRNSNAANGIQTGSHVYVSAIKSCDSISDTSIRNMVIYAINFLQEGYLPKSKDDITRVLKEIEANIDIPPNSPVDGLEQRLYSMLLFELLRAAWQSVKITNGDLDDIYKSNFASSEMKNVLNYLRGLEVDESVLNMAKMPVTAEINAKKYLYNELKDTSTFCRAINDNTPEEEAIKVIKEIQKQGNNESKTALVEGLEEIYPRGTILSIRHEPDGKSCEVLVVIRGSKFLGFLGDWFSLQYGGNLYLGLFTDIREHYGYHLRSNHMYDKICEVVSNQVKDKTNQEVDKTVRIVLVGHSQGGAVATLLAKRFEKEENLKITGVFLYTFGSPTPLRNAPEAYKLSGVRHYRFINAWDPVPEAFRVFNRDYCHFGAANPLPLHCRCLWSGHNIQTYANNIAVEAEASSISSNYVGNYITTLTPHLWTGERCRPWVIFTTVHLIAVILRMNDFL